MSGVVSAIEAIRSGGIAIVSDAPDREDESDLVLAADGASVENISFLLRHGTGIICASMGAQRAAALELPLMVDENTEAMRTAFTISVDARDGIETGVSAADRSLTLRVLADLMTRPSQLTRPGHVFPLIANQHGVLARRGHTEASLDLVRMAGRNPVAVLTEIMSEDRTTMARRDEVERFSRTHGIPRISIADLRCHRLRTENHVIRLAVSELPTHYGRFRTMAYRSLITHAEHLVVIGEARSGKAPLVRVHSECLTGDVFRSVRCDCGKQIQKSLERLAEEGGVVIYLRGHEGRGIGLGAKMQAYELQDRERLDTIDANIALGLPVDARSYADAAQILRDLGMTSVRLLTNNPAKIAELKELGIEIERVPLLIAEERQCLSYVRTKQVRLGHHDAL